MNSSSWGIVGREMPQPALAEGASVGAMSPRQWGQVECTRGGGQKHSWSAVPRQHRARAMTRLCQQSAGAGGGVRSCGGPWLSMPTSPSRI